MNARLVLVILAGIVAIGPLSAPGMIAADELAGKAALVPPAINDLEQAILALEREMSSDTPSTQPATATSTAAAETETPSLPLSLLPWSTEYRTITTTVTFSLLSIAHEDGPITWYTQGSFADPEDGRIYHFLFNDMGAMAASRQAKLECVVVFRPFDRQLTESDIAAMIPVEWVKETAKALPAE